MVLEKGNRTVQGNLTAGKITGDGSGITNISGLSQISDSIAILIQEIKQKADTIHTHTADRLNWKAGSEGQVWKV
ncbi:MAG: hypothetical protein GX640_24115 [Fibrobacter sp.]|nr:hypothetical protein [Fibrobacter sp.]